MLRGVARRFGDRLIFEDVDVEVQAGERLALTGENGSGKSTLLRLMAGLDAPDAGQISRSGRVALLAQEAPTQAGTVLEAVTPLGLRTAQLGFEAASAALADPTEAALAAFGTAEETYRTQGGYDFAAQAAAVLAGLDLHPDARADRLSGGQARRVLLARLLLSPADLYLLDEPTNHLDAASVAWLETWIGRSDAAFVLASHDRAFLDATARRVAELERGQLSEYPGNYSQAMALKAELRAAQTRQHEAGRRQRSALAEEAARRQSKARSAGAYNPRRASDGDKLLAKGKAQNAQNVNASRAKVLEKRLEQLPVIEKPFDDRRVVRLDLPAGPPGPAEVLTARHLSVARGEHPVLTDLNLDVRRGDRIALVGPNGGGKSTLLSAVLGRLPHSGELRLGQKLSVYWAGQAGEELAGSRTLADALLDANSALTPHQLYEVAAQLGLPPDPGFPIESLSGGGRTRLSLARLGVTRAQLLVLDEPTNHLDIRAIEALEETLLAYRGTVLLASHDRRLVERVANRVWWMQGGGVDESGR